METAIFIFLFTSGITALANGYEKKRAAKIGREPIGWPYLFCLCLIGCALAVLLVPYILGAS